MTGNHHRRKFGLWALALTLLFVIVSTFIPRTPLLAILNGVFLGVVVCVGIVYFPLVWLTFWKGGIDRVSQLAVGIGLIWISIAGQRLYWIVWHYFDTPAGWQSNPFLAAMAYISVIGGCLFVTAPGYPSEPVSRHVEIWSANRALLFVLGAIGGTVAFLVSIWDQRFI